MATDMKQAYSARKKLALRTKGNECSSLRNYPTPEAHTVEKYSLQKDGQKKTQRSRNLTAMAINGELSNWPTPRAGNPGSRKPGTGGKILAEEAKKNWPTPATRDHHPQGVNHNTKAQSSSLSTILAKKHNGLPVPEKSNMTGKNHGSWPTPTSNAVTGGQTGLAGGSGTRASLEEKLGRAEAMKLNAKLNPNWVEQLMGLPVGWTQLPTEWIDSAS
jgi:hypothetical protein